LREKRNLDTIFAYGVLALAIIGILSVIFIPSIPQRWRVADVAQVCNGEKSYYYACDLYNAEKKSFTDQAKAYQILYFGGERLRIVSDLRQTDDKKADFIVELSNAGRQNLDLSKIKLTARFSDQTELPVKIEKSQAKLKVANSIFLLETKEIKSDFKDGSLSFDLVIEDLDNRCSLTIAKAGTFNLPAPKRFASGAINTGEFGALTIASGLSPVGFSDWRMFEPFFDQGLSLLTFNGKNWQEVSQASEIITDPGEGYYFYSPRAKPVQINPGMYFEVPNDLVKTTVHQGWNLLYNSLGRDARLSEIKVSAWPKDAPRSFLMEGRTLESLVEGGYASGRIYLTDNPKMPNNFGLYPLEEEGLLPEASVFWFYLFDLPKSQAELPNFDLSLTADKDEYKSGEQATLTYKIANNDPADRIVDAAAENDPCLVGVEIFDAAQNKIYSEKDSSQKICPLWPQTITLKKGETVQYSRPWMIPKSVSGQLKLRGFFDYTRLGSSDMINSEITVKVGK